MGPHPYIVRVLADDRERLVRRELVRRAEDRRWPLAAGRCRQHQGEPGNVARDGGVRAGRRSIGGRMRFARLLSVLFLGLVAATGSAGLPAAAWESSVGSTGAVGVPRSRSCTVQLGSSTRHWRVERIH